MLLTKRLLLRFFFCIEIFIFLFLYIFGTQGLHMISKIRKENKTFLKEVSVLEGELQELENTIFEWEANPFYKEKAAREQLHMARKKDTIYFIK